MFKLSKFPDTTELSFHERRDLSVRSTLPHVANIHRAFLLDGSVDMGILQQALDRLCLRHDALRTRFVKGADGGFSREIMQTGTIVATHVDFGDIDPHDPAIKKFLSEEAESGIPAEAYPLARCKILSLRGNHSLYLFSIAECIVDGKSAAMLTFELSRLYIEIMGGEAAALPPLQFQLSDFVASQNAWMQTQSYRDSLHRVCTKLQKRIDESGGIDSLLFKQQTTDSTLMRRDFEQDTNEKIVRIASSLKASVPSVLAVASIHCVANGYERDHVFYTFTSANRHFSGAANIIGHLATTVPMYMNARKYPHPSRHIQDIYKELFTSIVQDGMVPIQEIGREVKSMFATPSDGSSIKFGKIVVDIMHEEYGRMFGHKAQTCVAWIPRPMGAEMKFMYSLFPNGDIKLWIRALHENGSEQLGARILEKDLDQTFDLLASVPQTVQ